VAGYLQSAVSAVDGNMRKAAKLLGISPSTLYARLKK
jgi:transcriptional regulator of acetoin/glycerol metabolism